MHAFHSPSDVGLTADAPQDFGVPGLPRQLSSFGGRQREMDMVRELLRDPAVRLLTLTGAGGVGKTRLAIQIAHDVAGDYPDGVWYVPLAQVRQSARVPATIAQALSIAESGNRSVLDGIAERLGPSRGLLVVDNFEHVVEAAPFLAALLSACPSLTCLVTSRVVLQLTGEHAFPVPPLALPPTTQHVTADHIGRSPAVRLLVDRARAARPDFELSDANAADVEAICRRLDGVPLAIELAAARLRHMSVGEVAERISSPTTGALRVLIGGPRDAPARQRTIRNAISWSYDLLPDDQRTVLRRTAVFVGGFTREAARAVAGDDPGDSTVEDAIPALVDHSLLRVSDGVGRESRYTMLETVREFGLEQLEVHGELEATQAHHAAWYARQVTWQWNRLLGEHLTQHAWLAWADAEQDNVRAALGWSLASGDAESAAWLSGAFHWFWEYRGLFREGLHWLEQALDTPGDVPPMARAWAVEGKGVLTGLLGNWQAGIDCLREALELNRIIVDHRGVARAALNLGIRLIDAGEYGAAVEPLRESISAYQALGSVWGAALAQAHLGSAHYGMHHLEEAVNLLQPAWELAREANDPLARFVAPLFCGLVACEQRKPASAARWFGEVLSFYAEHDGLVVAWRMDPDGAARSVASVAVLAGLIDQPEQAARLLGAARRPQEQIGLAFAFPEQTAFRRLEAQTRAVLGDDAFDAALAAGHQLSPDKVATEVDSVLQAAAASAPGGPADMTDDGFALTVREREVLTLLLAGHTDREIADLLYISHRTVNKHVGNILAKLGAKSRGEAAILAIRHGFV